ncbi:hypothetical protein JTE90_013819 [Oedothorax gibbosus]|uniref:LNR domain-containing protein n=1 Tax=Oedothorax gibbosus TaxID=931172 RepID=A0AAV6VI15_9ARAC|nr:hypothetical protein JTE90_013819 [Oedothorax gibbosus]
MAGTLLCKLIQRKTYDVLAKKHTILLVFVGFIILGVSTLRFGETLLAWSKDKYSVVFSPYSSNILGQNYRNMLCQYVPIDVVYTWVNGSDPAFLKDLVKAKEDYGFLAPSKNCSFLNCVKSHMVLVRPQLPTTVTLGDLEEHAQVFQNIEKSFVVTSHQKDQENMTVLVFADDKAAAAVVSGHVLTIDGHNHTLSPAFLTTDWESSNTVQIEGLLLVSPIGQSSGEDVLEKLPEQLKSNVKKVFIHEEKSLAVLSLSEAYSVNDEDLKANLTFGNKNATISHAYLVVELPSDHEDISASRFRDNEELRYSLRSLEKHAPWIQHVYIITNGQIPYWLNLDNPKVTVITHEVYLSWPVPNCAEGCPSSWIRDGYCDKPCNNSQCQWDGGDCSPDNPLIPQGGQLPQAEATSYFHMRLNKNYCNSECADTWLADRYCDKACNVRDCGFDAGDCGVDNFHKIPQLLLAEEQLQYELPVGECVGFFNLSLFLSPNLSLNEGVYEDSPVVRSLAISLKYGVIGIVLHPSHNTTNVTITLKGELNGQPFEKKIYLRVSTVPIVVAKNETESIDSSPQTEENVSFEEFQEKIKFPKLISAVRNETDFFKFRNVNVSASSLPESLIKEIGDLESLKLEGLMTNEGFLKRKSKLISVYLNSLNATFFPGLVTESPITQESPSPTSFSSPAIVHEDIKIEKRALEVNETNDVPVPSEKPSLIAESEKSNPFAAHFSDSRLFPKGPGLKANNSLKNYFMQLTKVKKDINETKVSILRPSGPTQRHLLDTFGDSLRHVNKLYNEAFGYESRKVPSHIAHFVDRDVMERLSQRFESAFEVTSSHRFRSSNDMQFAFSYYYFMMSEMYAVNVDDIFDMFDVDNSGTWSDREIRTIMARLYDLPLDFSSVSGFESLLINCSGDNPQSTAQSIEQYYEPKMPLVTRDLATHCQGIVHLLLLHFGSRKTNAFQVMGEEEVAFKMIHNNLTQVLAQVDDLRKNPKKFVCLNDNMNHGSKEAEVIRAVVQDFYESLFPMRSQFELAPEFRNRFLRVEELKEWRQTRDLVRIVTYLTLAVLVIFSIYSFWKAELRTSERYPRLRNIQNRSRNAQHV